VIIHDGLLSKCHGKWDKIVKNKVYVLVNIKQVNGDKGKMN